MKEKRMLTYLLDAKNRLNTYYNHKSNDIDIPRNIEILIRENGSIGYAPKLKKWVIGKFNGIKDELNDFTTYVCVDLSSEPTSYQLKNHEEVIVLRNNALCCSDIPVLEWDSQMRTENDISMYYQLVNSRNIPVIVANNDKVKRQIEKVFENIKVGVPCVITTDLLSEIEVKDIIDHDAISKMECLNELNEILTKRSMNWFGGTLDVKDKKAQVNSMELKAYDDFTTIGFLSNYQERLAFCEEMKENGIDYEITRNVIFSDEPSDEEIEKGEIEDVSNEEIKRDMEDCENNESTDDDE